MSSFLQVRVVELSVLTLHTSVTVLPISSTTTRGSVIEIAEVKICVFNKPSIGFQLAKSKYGGYGNEKKRSSQ